MGVVALIPDDEGFLDMRGDIPSPGEFIKRRVEQRIKEEYVYPAAKIGGAILAGFLLVKAIRR